MGTHEEEFPEGAPEPPKAPEPEPEPQPAEQKVVTCNKCGKQYKAGHTEKTMAVAVKRMKAHLEKEHGIKLENKDEDAKDTS